MSYREDIAELILTAAAKEVPPLVAHITNFPELNQQDVEDTVKHLIDEQGLKATYNSDYNEICSITFIPQLHL